MTRHAWWWVGAVVAFIVLAAVLIGAFAGGSTTVSAGTQPTVCGVRIGILSADEDHVAVGWDDQRADLAVGEKVRVAPWCVIQITGIDTSDDPAQVTVEWSTW